MNDYWPVFVELIATPFKHAPLVWGIVPLYFGLLTNELTSPRANFRTAIQTGFSLIWAGVQWLYPYFMPASEHGFRLDLGAMLPVNLLVTFLVLMFGVIALASGVRRSFPHYGRFLGHTRFVNYFMIMIFPMQAHALVWTWARLIVLVVFAVPVWLILYFSLLPLRNRN